MQNIHKKFRSVLNIFQVVQGVVGDPPPSWHDVGARNALVYRGLKHIHKDEKPRV